MTHVLIVTIDQPGYSIHITSGNHRLQDKSGKGNGACFHKSRDWILCRVSTAFSKIGGAAALKIQTCKQVEWACVLRL